MNKDWWTLLSMMGFLYSPVALLVSKVMGFPEYINTLIGFVLLVSAVYFFSQVYVPAKNFTGNPDVLFRNAETIGKSGDALVSGRCDGSLMFDRTTGFLATLRVSVYTSGVVIIPILSKPIGIYFDEIIYIRRKSIWTLEINHTARLLTNPVLLYIGENNKLSSGLQEIFEEYNKLKV